MGHVNSATNGRLNVQNIW